MRTIYTAIARCSERATTANIACSPRSQIETGGELYMRNALPAVAVALFCISLAHAQTDVLIEIDSGRTEGLFTKSPVFQRAILAKPAKPADTALLYFRGYPGIARIQSVADKQANLQPFMRINQQIFAEEGIDRKSTR